LQLADKSLRQFLIPLRFAEVLIMSGFFLIGYVYAIDLFSFTNPSFWQLFAGVVIYILSVYFLNSYFDYQDDQQNPRLTYLATFKRNHYLVLTGLAVLSFSAIFFFLKLTIFLISILSFSLWLMYYKPGIRLKGSFLFGTVIHLVGGILHFHIGYLVASPFSMASLALSFYIAWMLCIGHFHHEIIDYEADKKNDLRTTTVRVGIDPILNVIGIMFILSILIWLTIYWMSYIDFVEFVPFFLASFVLTVTYYIKRSTGSLRPLAFRRFYRVIFFIAGLSVLGSKIF